MLIQMVLFFMELSFSVWNCTFNCDLYLLIVKKLDQVDLWSNSAEFNLTIRPKVHLVQFDFPQR